MVVTLLAALMLSSLERGVSPVSASTESPSTSTGILEPAYWNDDNGSYTQHVIQAHDDYPSVPYYVIINPSSGPGDDQNSGILAMVEAFVAAGIKVLGYVNTADCDDSIATVEHAIDNYSSFYQTSGQTGIFFDNMAYSGTCSGTGGGSIISYYATLTEYAISHDGFKYTIGNPGVDVNPSFITSGTATVLNTFENRCLPKTVDGLLTNGTAYCAPYDNNGITGNDTSSCSLYYSNNTVETNGWHLCYPKEDFSFISYDQATLPSASTIAGWAQNVGLLYISDDGGGTGNCATPYIQPAGTCTSNSNYLKDEVQALAQIDGTDEGSGILQVNTENTAAAAVSGLEVYFAQKVFQTSGSCTNATCGEINQNMTMTSGGIASVEINGTQGLDYSVYAAGNTNCSFYEWGNDLGTSDPLTGVALSSSKLVLTAIYENNGDNTCPASTGGSSTITLENHASTSGTVSSSPYHITLSSFDAGSGSDRELIVGISANDEYATSVTFGGTSLTQLVSSFYNNDAELWGLTDPSGTENIVVTMSGATSVVVGAYELAGVSQSDPVPTTNSTYNLSSSSPSISLNTQYSNSWVIDQPSIWGGVTLGSPTCSQAWDVNVADEITGASSSTSTSSANTYGCSWTASDGGDLWDDVAIEVQASTTSSGGISEVNEINYVGTVSSSPYQVTVTDFNVGSGSDRLLLVGIAADDEYATTVKFGTTSLTKAVSSFYNNDAEYWYLTDPSGTENVVVTFDGPTSFSVGVVVLDGVSQSDPIPTTAYTHNTSPSSPSISITTHDADSWVLDDPSIYGSVSLSAPSGIQLWDGQWVDAITGAGSYTATTSAGSYTASWTASSGGELWDDVAIEVQAS
jgi:hypothetical protein